MHAIDAKSLPLKDLAEYYEICPEKLPRDHKHFRASSPTQPSITCWVLFPSPNQKPLSEHHIAKTPEY